MVVTTAKGYTPAAVGEARVTALNKSRYRMELLAFDDVVKMLKLPQPKLEAPWKRLLGIASCELRNSSKSGSA
jgi:hypothetical protein